MYLQKFRLQNFRLFEDTTFFFEKGFNIIIGNNMTGKTSILKGILLGGAYFISQISNITKPLIEKEDIRLRNFGRNIEPQLDVVLEYNYDVFDKKISWKTVKKGLKTMTKQENQSEILELCKKVKKNVQNNEDIILPILAYYPTEKDLKDVFYWSTSLGSRLDGYANATLATKNYQEIQNWLITKQIKINSKVNDFVKAEFEFNLVKQVLLNVLNLKDLFFDIDLQTASRKLKDFILHFELPDGRVLPVSALSSGYKIIFAMVGDLAVRCVRLNPSLGEEAIIETNGIVLIDEIDQHLHPILQQKIVNILKTTFPKLQFIVTTHSPHIVASAEANEVINLPDIEQFEALKGEIKADERSYQGWQLEYILRDVMAMKEKNTIWYEKTVNPILDKIEMAFEKKNLQSFETEIDKLKKILNPNNPILASLEIQKLRLKLK